MAAALLGVGLGLSATCGGAAREGSRWRDPEPGIFETGPYLLASGGGKALVALKADVPGTPQLEWQVAGRDSGAAGAWTTSSFARAGDLWLGEIDGAADMSGIRYRVSTELGASDLFEARLGRRVGESFRLAILRVSPHRPVAHRKQVQALAAQQVDVVVHVGDLVAGGDSRDSWDRFFQIERPLLRRTPMIAMAAGSGSAAQLFRHYLRRDQRFGRAGAVWFDWGHLRVVQVSRNSTAEARAAARRALAEGAETDMLMILVADGWAGGGPDGASLAALAARFGVELIVWDSSGGYRRSGPVAGAVHLAIGEASKSPGADWVQPAAFESSELSYLIVDIDAGGLILNAVDSRGQSLDTHVVAALPPPR